jgi:hypothetical protein
MIYTMPDSNLSNPMYSTSNKADFAYPVNADEIEGAFGNLYITDHLPYQWTLFAHSAGTTQDLADYLLANRVGVDEEISSAISKYFWDF